MAIVRRHAHRRLGRPALWFGFIASSSVTLLTAATHTAPVLGAEPGPEVRGQPAAATVPDTLPPRLPIADFSFRGVFIDPVAKLDRYAQILAPRGSPFVEDGPADTTGLPIGTVARLRAGFGTIGYDATINPRPGPSGGGLILDIELRPADRVRHIFVEGNWPLRQDEIIRRLSLRPGHVIPHVGSERDRLLAAERDRILTFLRSQGYLDAKVEIILRGRGTIPANILLVVRIDLGPGYPVGEIRINGTSPIPAEEIEARYRHGDWRFLWLRPMPFQQNVVREDTTDLTLELRALGYPGARVLPTFNLRTAHERGDKTVPLTLDIRKNKKIDIVFEGNECCAEADLRDVLTLLRRGSHDDIEVQASRAALARFLRERGNMFAEVQVRREPITEDHERIVFSIAEGPRLRVRSVRVDGSTRIPARTLTEIVTVRPYPFLGLGAGGHTSLVQLQNDAQRIVDHYERQGFRGARVAVEIGPRLNALRPIETTLAGTDRHDWLHAHSIHVRFVVLDEGRLIRVGRIRFRSADGTKLPRDENYLGNSILMRPGRPFRESMVRSDGNRIITVLRDAGHPNGIAEPELAEHDGQVDITWIVTPGPQVIVGPIFIRGNFYTSDSTILKWIPLQEGSALTETGFERGQRQLSLLQFFTNANPIRFPGLESGLSEVPMLVQVEERHDHWGSIRVGVGGATDQRTPGVDFPLGGFISLGYEHGNFLGRGYLVRSRAAVGNALTRAQADVENPRLLSTLFRLELSSAYLRQQTVRLGDVRSGSAVIGLARQVHPGVDVFLRYGVRDIVRTEPFVRVAGADETQRTVQLGTLVGSLSFGVELLRLDNLLVPQQGLRVHGSVELALPSLTLGFGDDRFIKLHGAVLNVVPLSRRVSLRHSIRYDHGIPMGSPFLPKVERFFAGGDTTLRGYQLDRARTESARSELAPGIGYVQIRPVGGNLRILNNLDLQYRVVGSLYMSVFVDSGIVEDGLSALSPMRFRHGAGFSPLVVKLPIGDLSVSWAWPLIPGPGDSRYGRMHFNVGLMF